MEGERVAAGDVLRGRVLTARDLWPSAGFRLRLACTKTITIAESAGPSADSAIGRREDRLRHESEVVVAGVTASARDGIPVQITLPKDAIAPTRTGRGLAWTLEVHADVDGKRFEALFAIPVAR
jgi:hypothetical protein